MRELRTVAVICAVIFPVVIAMVVVMAGIIVWAESGPSWLEPVVLGFGVSVGVGVMTAGLLKRRR